MKKIIGILNSMELLYFFLAMTFIVSAIVSFTKKNYDVANFDMLFAILNYLALMREENKNKK